MSSLRPSMAPNSNATAPAPSNGLFGHVSAHNPVWKHEVSLLAVFHHVYHSLLNSCHSDVTSTDSQITYMVYDRAVSDQGFLGSVKIRPLLIHDHTVDDWYKYVPCFDPRSCSVITMAISASAHLTNSFSPDFSPSNKKSFQEKFEFR